MQDIGYGSAVASWQELAASLFIFWTENRRDKQYIRPKFTTMQLQNTFVHHVFFWLKDKADQAKLIEGLEMLGSIEHIRQIHVGVAADTNRDVIDSSYDASLLILFDNKAEQDGYQDHPTHLVFVDKYAKPLCAKIVVYDSVNI